MVLLVSAHMAPTSTLSGNEQGPISLMKVREIIYKLGGELRWMCVWRERGEEKLTVERQVKCEVTMKVARCRIQEQGRCDDARLSEGGARARLGPNRVCRSASTGIHGHPRPSTRRDASRVESEIAALVSPSCHSVPYPNILILAAAIGAI